jgi:hypothetical protein
MVKQHPKPRVISARLSSMEDDVDQIAGGFDGLPAPGIRKLFQDTGLIWILAFRI